MLITINNTELNVTITNPNQHKKTLIWMHGITSNIQSNMLNNSMSALEVAEHCQLIRFDARSHGKSDDDIDPIQHTWHAIAEDMQAVADHFQVEKFIAGGSSMGAGSALWSAALAPQRVAGLILSVPPDAWEMRPGIAAYWRQVAEDTAQGCLSSIIQKMIDEPIHPILKNQSDQKKVNLTAFMDHPDDALQAIFQGAAISDFPDVNKLSKMALPALILAWADLPGHSVDIATRLQTTLPNSQLNVATDYAQASSQTQLINDFLDKIEIS